MEAYFDNSATTKVLDSVKDIVVEAMTVDYGNPAAKHSKGMEAEKYIREAQKDDRGYPEGAGEGDPVYFRRYRVQQYGSDRHGAGQTSRAGKHIISTGMWSIRLSTIPLGFLEEHGL